MDVQDEIQDLRAIPNLTDQKTLSIIEFRMPTDRLFRDMIIPNTNYLATNFFLGGGGPYDKNEKSSEQKKSFQMFLLFYIILGAGHAQLGNMWGTSSWVFVRSHGPHEQKYFVLRILCLIRKILKIFVKKS